LEVVEKLRPATAADAPAVAACVTAAYRHYIARIGKAPGPMLEDYDEVLRTHRVFVVEREGAIVAVAVLIVEHGRALLDNVAVLPQFQGCGLGRRLITHAEEEARRLGFAAIELYTHELMTENIALYRRLGYEEFARRAEKGYKRVYMRKALGASK
jgi:ribosomal protein S18 acetylase RimI-like enzyme